MGYIRQRMEKRKQMGRPGAWLSLGLCFMLFLFAPAEIYLNNQSDFWYDLFFVLPYYLLCFAATFAGSVLLFMVLGILGDKWYDLGLAAYFWVLVGCYYQGNFQVKTLPTLDGTEFEPGQYTGEFCLSCAVWILLLAVTVILLWKLGRERFRNMMRGVGVFVFLVLLVTAVTLFFTTKGYERADYLTCTKEGMFEMSEDQNFVIFILDAVDAGMVEEVAERHPEYREALRDFTYFSNTMSGYPCTDCAVPLALTGEWFENKEPFQDYINRSFSQGKLFAALEEKGYELGLYDTEILLPESVVGNRYHNMIHSDIRLSDPVLFIKRELKLVGFKYVPWILKRYCWFDAHKLWNHRDIEVGDDSEVFFWEDDLFYADLTNCPITYTDMAQFKLIHLEGAHSPFVYDAQVNVVDDASYDTCVEASMTVLLAYLEKLRKAGVYDNSVLVIMADHGLGESREYDMFGRQHPILFIKGAGEQHAFRTDDAPIAQEDLAEACEKLLTGADSAAVFDWKEGDSRVRRYLYYKVYNMNYMDEYIQRGHARDTGSMEFTGVEYNQ